jgi:hypothetical protein
VIWTYNREEQVGNIQVVTCEITYAQLRTMTMHVEFVTGFAPARPGMDACVGVGELRLTGDGIEDAVSCLQVWQCIAFGDGVNRIRGE